MEDRRKSSIRRIPSQDEGPKARNKVRFSSNFVKEFATTSEHQTVWDSTYEESIGSQTTNSSSSVDPITKKAGDGNHVNFLLKCRSKVKPEETRHANFLCSTKVDDALIGEMTETQISPVEAYGKSPRFHIFTDDPYTSKLAGPVREYQTCREPETPTRHEDENIVRHTLNATLGRREDQETFDCSPDMNIRVRTSQMRSNNVCRTQLFNYTCTEAEIEETEAVPNAKLEEQQQQQSRTLLDCAQIEETTAVPHAILECQAKIFNNFSMAETVIVPREVLETTRQNNNRRTQVFHTSSIEADVEVTAAVPRAVLETTRQNNNRRTQVFNLSSTEADVEVTAAVPRAVLETIRQNNNRRTHFFHTPPTEAKVEVTVALPPAELETTRQNNNRRTQVFHTSSTEAEVEVTSAVPRAVLETTRQNNNRRTHFFHTPPTETEVEVTAAVPQAELETTRQKNNRRTQIFNLSSKEAEVEVTTAVPRAVLETTRQNQNRGTQVFDFFSTDTEVEVTAAAPHALLQLQQVSVLDDDDEEAMECVNENTNLELDAADERSAANVSQNTIDAADILLSLSTSHVAETPLKRKPLKLPIDLTIFEQDDDRLPELERLNLSDHVVDVATESIPRIFDHPIPKVTSPPICPMTVPFQQLDFTRMDANMKSLESNPCILLNAPSQSNENAMKESPKFERTPIAVTPRHSEIVQRSITKCSFVQSEETPFENIMEQANCNENAQTLDTSMPSFIRAESIDSASNISPLERHREIGINTTLRFHDFIPQIRITQPEVEIRKKSYDFSVFEPLEPFAGSTNRRIAICNEECPKTKAINELTIELQAIEARIAKMKENSSRTSRLVKTCLMNESKLGEEVKIYLPKKINIKEDIQAKARMQQAFKVLSVTENTLELFMVFGSLEVHINFDEESGYVDDICHSIREDVGRSGAQQFIYKYVLRMLSTSALEASLGKRFNIQSLLDYFIVKSEELCTIMKSIHCSTVHFNTFLDEQLCLHYKFIRRLVSVSFALDLSGLKMSDVKMEFKSLRVPVPSMIKSKIDELFLHTAMEPSFVLQFLTAVHKSLQLLAN